MDHQCIVKVNEGLLEGELVENEFGGRYYSFKGIPYAKPPLGDLRFMPPQPLQSWDGVRSAKEFGPISYQFDALKKIPSSGSEACLYINVYSPNIKPKSALPVMVWIHGGGFIWGSGNDDVYGPQFIVRQDVILVTFNYRLGALGFLCLDTKDVPGNAGMKDQVLALKWVKKNINNFGGDPENITIFGESAGAACVSLHLISPMSKGLFKRAIVQSGAPTAFWTQSFEPREKALTLARKLGISTENDKALYEFLKTQPKEVLIKHRLPVTYANREHLSIDFPPTIEKNFGQEMFLHEDFDKLLCNGIHEGVDVMTGYVEDEGVFIFLESYDVLDKNNERINDFLEAMVPLNLARKIPIKQQLEVGRKMKKFYLKDQPASRNNWKNVLRYINFEMFVYDVIHFQNTIADTNNSYFYKFTCKSKRNFFKKIFTADDVTKDVDVVCHCVDLSYLFPVEFFGQKVEKDSKEFQLIETVTKLWTNFAKHGNPTPDNSLGVKWEPYCLQHQRYLDIGEKLALRSRPDDEQVQFWENIFKEYSTKNVQKIINEKEEEYRNNYNIF